MNLLLHPIVTIVTIVGVTISSLGGILPRVPVVQLSTVVETMSITSRVGLRVIDATSTKVGVGEY